MILSDDDRAVHPTEQAARAHARVDAVHGAAIPVVRRPRADRPREAPDRRPVSPASGGYRVTMTGPARTCRSTAWTAVPRGA